MEPISPFITLKLQLFRSGVLLHPSTLYSDFVDTNIAPTLPKRIHFMPEANGSISHHHYQYSLLQLFQSPTGLASSSWACSISVTATFSSWVSRFVRDALYSWGVVVVMVKSISRWIDPQFVHSYSTELEDVVYMILPKDSQTSWADVLFGRESCPVHVAAQHDKITQTSQVDEGGFA